VVEGPPLDVMLAAWPPVEREALGDWSLRFSGGFTGRANSVLPVGDPGIALAEAVARCEAAYGARELPATFQLRDGLTTAGLAALLRARGYLRGVTALVLAGPLPQAREDAAIEHHDDPSPAWLETWLRSGRDLRDAPLAAPVLARVSRPRTFAVLRDEGRVVGTALGTLSPGWLGLSCLAVDPDARRAGLGGRLLGALAAWSRSRGARGLWLEVEPDNEVAFAWYRRLGLEQVHAYGYLTAASIARTVA
jgi:ribosomal protein S18 acetylase RimI-like enzyme